MADKVKPNTPGPLEQKLIAQGEAGAWALHVEDYDSLGKLSTELGLRYDRINGRKWGAWNNGEAPPPWANFIYKGLPVYVGRGLHHGDNIIPAFELLRQAIRDEVGGVMWRVKVREYLREMLADRGLPP